MVKMENVFSQRSMWNFDYVVSLSILIMGKISNQISWEWESKELQPKSWGGEKNINRRRSFSLIGHCSKITRVRRRDWCLKRELKKENLESMIHVLIPKNWGRKHPTNNLVRSYTLNCHHFFVEGKQELTEISSFEATKAKLEVFIEGRIWWWAPP